MNTSFHNKMLCFTIRALATPVYSYKHRPHHASSHNVCLLTITTPIQSQYAQHGLGYCYEQGRGATQNYQEARRLYALASLQGFANATVHLNLLDQKIRTECSLLITGTSREDLNGRAGVATSSDHARGRYVVELDSKEGEKEKERLKVKPQNLSTQTARKQGKKKGRK